MIICDCCEKPNKCQNVTVKIDFGVVKENKEHSLHICDECIDLVWMGNFIIGMKQIKLERDLNKRNKIIKEDYDFEQGLKR